MRENKLPCLITSYKLRDLDIAYETLGRNDQSNLLANQNCVSSQLYSKIQPCISSTPC
jgi:hypothetical protein